MQDKDLKTKLVAFRINKQLLGQFEQAKAELEKGLGKQISGQRVFELILAYYIYRNSK
jgi:hypothetical protein